MKAKFVAIAILAAILMPALCQATSPNPGSYLSGFIGVTVPKDSIVLTDNFVTNNSFTDRVEFYPGINLGLTAGYDYGYLRMEGELSYKYTEIKDVVDQADNFSFRNVNGNLGALAMLFNTFADLHNASPLTPYFGGGIGFATLYLGDTSGTDTRGGILKQTPLYLNDYDTVFAYQIGGGVEIALNPALSLDLGYRYFGTSTARFENSIDQSTRLKLESHNATVGLRMKF